MPKLDNDPKYSKHQPMDPPPPPSTKQWTENPADKPAEGKPENPTPPEVKTVRDGGSGGGDVSVDTEVLRRFAAAAEDWKTHVTTAKNALDTIDVRPTGTEAFTEGANIKRLVNGDGLRGQYQKNLMDLIDAFAALSTGLLELGKKYESTEELNAKGADELGKVLANAGRYLPGGATPPPPPPPPPSKGQ
ncbi:MULTISPECIES: hypothetical protein [unclassified Crossiella]|uniref:hypothetical protein n=1 Tax=Crossiella sp. SN42 TaxID=2944808 RepID=UPI00207C96FE|nr:hypothetical protein [Crossiella sp. SN42]MCO1582613.1 hypothetical protein [Crossiella sp. SN42]